jgi:hypothetical protein
VSGSFLKQTWQRRGRDGSSRSFGTVSQRLKKGCAQLFRVSWEFIDTSEDGIRRSLALFSNWEAPGGAEFKGFYGFAVVGVSP